MRKEIENSRREKILIELVNENKFIKEILRIGALIWLITWLVAFGSIALTNSDFTQLGTVLESVDSSETEMVLVKAIINIGLNLHIFLGIPTALFWASEIDRNKNQYKSYDEQPLKYMNIAEIGAGKAVQELDPTLLEMLEKSSGNK